MKKIRLTESELTNIVKRVINEQETQLDEKQNLIKVLMDKLNYMKTDNKFDANAVCQTIINNCNNFKNKTDIFAKK